MQEINIEDVTVGSRFSFIRDGKIEGEQYVKISTYNADAESQDLFILAPDFDAMIRGGFKEHDIQEIAKHIIDFSGISPRLKVTIL